MEKGGERIGWGDGGSESDKPSFSCYGSHDGTGDMGWWAKGRMLALRGRGPAYEPSVSYTSQA